MPGIRITGKRTRALPLAGPVLDLGSRPIDVL